MFFPDYVIIKVMKTKNQRIILIFTLIFITFNLNINAQTRGASGLDLSRSPQWVRDLRRAEIIAFGTFPFTFFFTSLTMDTVRLVRHDWDMRYAPWPLKSSGAVEMTRNEQIITISVAAGTSLTMALIDFIIVRSQRKKQQQQILSQPPGIPIIIRRPIDPDGNPIEDNISYNNGPP